MPQIQLENILKRPIYGSTDFSLVENNMLGSKIAFTTAQQINTGEPQGCVLSASLFIIYESDNGPENKNCILNMQMTL